MLLSQSRKLQTSWNNIKLYLDVTQLPQAASHKLELYKTIPGCYPAMQAASNKLEQYKTLPGCYPASAVSFTQAGAI